MTANTNPTETTRIGDVTITTEFIDNDGNQIRHYAVEHRALGTGATLIERAADALSEAGVWIEGRTCQHGYDCCGRLYPDAVEFVRWRADRAIYRQRFTRNI